MAEVSSLTDKLRTGAFSAIYNSCEQTHTNSLTDSKFQPTTEMIKPQLCTLNIMIWLFGISVLNTGQQNYFFTLKSRIKTGEETSLSCDLKHTL